MNWRPTHQDVFVYALQKLRARLLLASVEKEVLRSVFNEHSADITSMGYVMYMGQPISGHDMLVFDRLLEIESKTKPRRRAA